MISLISHRVIVSLAAAAVATLTTNAEATTHRPRRHHHRVAVVPVAPAPQRAIPRDYSFYPERVEGGVDGNLPFNNQIRKLVDPLNANGAGR